MDVNREEDNNKEGDIMKKKDETFICRDCGNEFRKAEYSEEAALMRLCPQCNGKRLLSAKPKRTFYALEGTEGAVSNKPFINIYISQEQRDELFNELSEHPAVYKNLNKIELREV